MRPDHLAIAAALVAAGGVLAACGSKTGADHEIGGGYPAPPPVSPPHDDAAQVHREFVDAVNRRIDAIGMKMGELKAKIVSAAEDQKPNLQKLSDDLARKKDAVAADLKSLGDATAEKWDATREKLEGAVLDLEKAATEALK